MICDKQKYLSSNESDLKEVENNFGLVIHIVREDFKYTGLEYYELVDIGSIGLIKAVKTYHKEKGNFSYYASRCISNEISMYLRGKNKIAKKEISIDKSIREDDNGKEITLLDTLSDNNDVTERIEKDEINKYLYKAIKILDERQEFIIRLYYGLGCYQKNEREIGEIIGISRSQVSKIISKCITIMKLFMIQNELLQTSETLDIKVEEKTSFNNTIPYFAYLVIKKDMSVEDISEKYNLPYEYVRHKLTIDLAKSDYEIFLKVNNILLTKSINDETIEKNENIIQNNINELLIINGTMKLIELCNSFTIEQIHDAISRLPEAQRKLIFILDQSERDRCVIIYEISKRYEKSLDFVLNLVKVAYELLYYQLKNEIKMIV